MKLCQACRGRKRVAPLGFVEYDCKACNGVGYVDDCNVVISNSYIINGSTNTFAIPESANSDVIIKEYINIRVGANSLPQNSFVYPSSTLGTRGIDLKPINSTVLSTAPSDKAAHALELFTNQYGNFTGKQLFSAIVRDVDIDAGIYYLNSTIVLPTANTEVLIVEVKQGDISFAPFFADIVKSEIVTANSNIQGITHSSFIAEKNAFEQNPLVRLYTVYYPGEWYPPNKNGNPTEDGLGSPWPYTFPYRFAEIRGDLISDLQYNVTFGAQSYVPYPIDSTGIQLDSTGKINQITLRISNYDNLITTLVENPFLVGNNKSNGTTATVNGEVVTNIDPRTIPNNISYDQDIVDSRGGVNLAFDYDSTINLAGTWTKLKQDSRDLLGAVVEIKSTYANFLKYWPEYSTVQGKYGNALHLYVTYPYRNGDIITTNSNTNATAIVYSVKQGMLITNSINFVQQVKPFDRILIVNPETDEDNFVLDTFKVESLQGLDEKVATFSLTSWLQYFKLQLPKRRYYKNTCPWSYKGEECQYPDNGTGSIPGSTETANGFFDINNAIVGSQDNDVCAKDEVGCELRRNRIHFGGFLSSSRTVPR